MIASESELLLPNHGPDRESFSVWPEIYSNAAWAGVTRFLFARRRDHDPRHSLKPNGSAAVTSTCSRDDTILNTALVGRSDLH